MTTRRGKRQQRDAQGPPRPAPARATDTPVGTQSEAPARLPRGTLILLATSSLIITAAGMHAIRAILAPVLLTLILVICVSPVARWVRRRGAPQGIATGAVILITLGLLAIFLVTGLLAVGQFVAMLPRYADEFAAAVRALGDGLATLGVDSEQIRQLSTAIDPENIVSAVLGAVGGVASIAGALVIVLTMIILMAADAAYLPTIARQLRDRRPHLVAATTQFAADVRRYMVVTTVLGLAQGALNALALWIVQVPAALLWGLLAFLCSFIPNVGYFFAIAPPLVFGYLVGGWPTVLVIVVVYGLINAVVQSVVQPRVVGQAVSLSQSLTFFSVLFWAVVLGPVGAILAIPLTLLAKAVLVDSEPGARFWQPAFGPTAETRGLKRAEDANVVKGRMRGAARHERESRT
jgi:AI-2 transport protein TqsA